MTGATLPDSDIDFSLDSDYYKSFKALLALQDAYPNDDFFGDPFDISLESFKFVYDGDYEASDSPVVRYK